ncbi:MAG TPA: Spy/CpxP family protein refolding chaperone [Terriglobales bacterium]|nr:Spy/CpxP family protein refolding chaperone [Terriglobales bacterium]
MRFGRLAPVSLVLTMALLTGAAAAQGRGPHRDGDFWGPMMREKLDLSDAQQAEIRQIYENGKPAMKGLWSQERASHSAMMKLITSGAFEAAKAQAIASQEAQVHAQLELAHAQMAAQAYLILTPEQKTKLNEILEEREQRIQEHINKGSQAPPSE